MLRCVLCVLPVVARKDSTLSRVSYIDKGTDEEEMHDSQ
jgi:hypothetical protein